MDCSSSTACFGPGVRIGNRFQSLCIVLSILLAHPGYSADTVRATLETETAWTGESVPLVITLYSPGPFSGAASFELPELPRTAIIKVGNPVVGSEVVDGETLFTQRHEFSLYTQLSGEIVIPPFSVKFKGKKSFVGDAEPMQGTTDQLHFESKRPPGTEKLGVVITTTEMTADQTWTPAEIQTVKAGDVIQRKITRRAVGTTAMMMPPVPTDTINGIRVYTAQPTVSDTTDRGQSSALRSEILKYQFERAGTYELPAISFSWWDASGNQLRREVIEGRTINVLPIASAVQEAHPTTHGSAISWERILGLIVLLVFLAWVIRKPFARLVAAWKLKLNSPEAVAARRVVAACRSSHAMETYVALLDWKRFVLSDGVQSEGTLNRAASETGLSHQWQRLSAQIFGSSGDSNEWFGRDLELAFDAMRRRLASEHAQTQLNSLPSLNPACKVSSTSHN